ncbi:MAG: ATP-binding cassette domain-containing protein [Rhizobacter sp.]|nr:ATP-binding cassette domain-containing protein [Chlorobiales bacterium]
MIEFKNVHLSYGTREILKGISLVIEDKKINVILGPSGAGKSTIIKLALGLIKPTSGQVLIDGTDISKFSEVELFPIRRKIAMVFQGNALFDSMTIEENMGFFLRENLRLPDDEIAGKVKEQMKFAGLEGLEDSLPDALSGGMRKRVAIGRALIFGPKTILLDEPTAGLDPLSAKKILNVIKQLRDETGVGSVMITHIISDIFGVANQVFILYNGEIIFQGPPEEMRTHDHPFIQSFLSAEEEI